MNILTDKQFRTCVVAYIFCLIYLGAGGPAVAFLLVLVLVFGLLWALIEAPDRKGK